MAAPMFITCASKRAFWSSIKVRSWCHQLRLRRCYMTGNRNLLKLHERGILVNVFPEEQTPDLYQHLTQAQRCMYCGFDPTSDSLHVGNLLAIIALLHGQRAGHKVIALIGGATAQIGDPSGKTKERRPMELDTIRENVEKISQSLTNIFDNHAKYFYQEEKAMAPARILDNSDWYGDKNIVEFLSTVGRHFRMGTMLGRQSVQTRLQSAEGMCLTEFTYQMFQAYDWLHLHQHHNCTLQVGGNDQMGNIMSGHDLIGRVTNKSVFGLTVPLIKSTTGDKLGKTAGNAVWLSREKTSPFELYQYCLNFADTDVRRYLQLFTFLSDVEIDTVMTQHQLKPASRIGQKKLAECMTLLVHGDEALCSARRCTDVLFGDDAAALARLSAAEVDELFRNAATAHLYLEPGTSVADVVLKAGCFSRACDADRVIRAGGVYVNQRRVVEPDAVLLPGEHILPNDITLLRVGKKNYYIVKWIGAVTM